MTYDEIKSYVQFEARDAELRQVGSYQSEPYAVVTGNDADGDEIVTDVTCTVSVHLLGDEAHGYILTTSDDADGPTDDLGRDVYPTAAAALDAMRASGADDLPATGCGIRLGNWRKQGAM